MIKKLTADFIYTADGSFVQEKVIEVMDNKIIKISPVSDYQQEELETYKGIICPGFINTHCHLELSYLKGRIAPKTGLDEFIRQIQNIRQVPHEERLNAIQMAHKELIDEGVVAVGDIANGNSTLNIKSQSDIYFHNFIEVFGFHSDSAEGAFNHGKQLYQEYLSNEFKASIIPHSPYSVSKELLQKITDLAIKNNSILSIHNQESSDENQLYQDKSGKILDRLHDFGIPTDFWQPTGQSSLLSIIPYFPQNIKTLLVHNTYTSKEDVEQATAVHPNLWWCFCSNANLYIENKLPYISMFLDHSDRITIGTDSLASNKKLSILEELKTIQQAFPEIKLETLLGWATINGANFLGMADQFGSIEVGKRSGLNLITDVKNFQLSNSSQVKKLL